MQDIDQVTKKVNWERMFPDEFVAARDACPVAYAAYGLAEPHGSYNALGLDFLKATALVERAAQTHGGIVAPPFAWHITELPFHTDDEGWFDKVGIHEPLASSVSRDVFYQVFLSQLRAFDARGFHAAILVTGHYGGVEKTMRDVCDIYKEKTNSPMQLYACADWELINLPNVGGDHAGATETSQLMALHEDMVDLSRPPVPNSLGSQYAGVEFPAGKQKRMPSKAFGEKIITTQIESLGEKAQQLLQSWQPREGYQPPTVPQIDAMWPTVRERLTRPF